MKICENLYTRMPPELQAYFVKSPNAGSDEVLSYFPDAPGQSGAVTGKEPSSKTNNVYGQYGGRPATQPRGDKGSAARFFYAAKCSTRERNEGLPEGMTNGHPTVKPLNLLQYLCRLITPPGGTILDCFAGSGSTGVAALREGFQFIGIEREPEYFEIAQARVAAAAGEPAQESSGREVTDQESSGQEVPATIPMPKQEPEQPVQPDLFGGAA
jgi:hypothetical protein